MSTEQRPDQQQFDSAKDPRRGMTPFAEGLNKGATPNFKFIKSKPAAFSDLGEMTVVLSIPQKQELQNQISKLNVSQNDQAITIGPSGQIKKGRLLDFLGKGYYNVEVEIDPQQHPIKPNQDLNVNIWIGEGPIIKSPLRGIRGGKVGSDFFKGYENGVLENFVLPNNQKILKALTVNVSSQ